MRDIQTSINNNSLHLIQVNNRTEEYFAQAEIWKIELSDCVQQVRNEVEGEKNRK